MVKRHSSKRRHSSKHHRSTKRRHYRGGAGGYSSAATYQLAVNGSEQQQYDRVFDKAGPYGNITGNTIIGAQGQNATFTGTPTQSQLSLIQSAGKKRHKKRMRGGVWGQVLSQAVVPATLVGLNQMYGKKTMKHRRRRRY